MPVVLAGDYNVVPTEQDIYLTRSLDKNLDPTEEPPSLCTTASSRLDRCSAQAAGGLLGGSMQSLRSPRLPRTNLA